MTAAAMSTASGADGDVVAMARAIVAFHLPTPEGFCGGCLRQWARLAPAPCEPLRWATNVMEAHRGAPAAESVAA